MLDRLSQDAKLSAAIAKLGVDRQVVRNRDSAMVLPHGISKRTGIEAALRALGETPAATVAVGDGENDVALFAVAGVSVAVANAVDLLKTARRRGAHRAERQGGAVTGGGAGWPAISAR